MSVCVPIFRCEPPKKLDLLCCPPPDEDQRAKHLLGQRFSRHLGIASATFHLLAAIELDTEEDVISIVEAAQIDTGNVLGQSLTWYQALALVKTGRNKEAAETLGALVERPGPYGPDAHKLQKMLLK